MPDITKAFKMVYGERRYITITALAFLFFLSLNYYALVYAVSGSSLTIFIETSAWWQIALPLLLSALIAILVGMQAWMLRKHFTKSTMTEASTGVFSSFAGMMGSVFGSAGCLSCLTTLFGFLGTGTLLFLAKYRYPLIGGSMLMLLFSIYMTAKNITCDACAVKGKKR